MQVAAVESEENLAGRCLKYGAFGTDVPRSAQSPLVQRRFRGRAVALCRILDTRSRGRKLFGLPISDIGFRGSRIRPVTLAWRRTHRPSEGRAVDRKPSPAPLRHTRP